jgi:flagellar assembly protein FliH
VSSRILSAEEAAAATTWEVPVVSDAARPLHGGALTGGVVRASTLEDLQREAYEEAFRQGYREGQTVGQREVAEQVRRFASLIDDLAHPFEDLDAEVEAELLQLALALAKQVVRRELRQDPTQIIATVREAIAALPVAAREVRVHLHPEDAAIIRQHLAPTESERAWVVVEDPVMMRGGCQVLTPTSRIDARLETRLGKVLSELLGGQRQTESRGPDTA